MWVQNWGQVASFFLALLGKPSIALVLPENSSIVGYERGSVENFCPMPEPITAVTIAALAFNEFIKSGAGELAKKSIGSGIEGVNQEIAAGFQN